MANINLSIAKQEKNDEFYTQYHDIEVEMNAYLDYDKDVFKGKTVLLPCDDPEWSNFTKYFAQKFETLGLKKLISTSFAVESKKYKGGYQPSLFEQNSPQYAPDKTRTHGKIFILDRDNSGDGRINYDDLQWDYLEGDGDFKSKEVTKLRDEADIIVTNPPFSLFREFVTWICQANKKFIIIGNLNAVTYKEIFPKIKSNEIWLGATNFNTGMYFRVPDDFVYAPTYKFETEQNGVKVNRVPGCCWFTNIDHGRRHQPLPLMSMEDNLRFSKHKEIKGRDSYIHYENFDAIDIPVWDAIPSDYEGIMGVPKTFVDKYCPEQFEIIGIAEGDSGKELGLKPFPRELKKLNPSLRDGQLYYIEDGMPVKPYARILIRKKQQL